jgi:hypothetical protein
MEPIMTYNAYAADVFGAHIQQRNGNKPSRRIPEHCGRFSLDLISLAVPTFA